MSISVTLFEGQRISTDWTKLHRDNVSWSFFYFCKVLIKSEEGSRLPFPLVLNTEDHSSRVDNRGKRIARKERSKKSCRSEGRAGPPLGRK